jgi:hypothetical protein
MDARAMRRRAAIAAARRRRPPRPPKKKRPIDIHDLPPGYKEDLWRMFDLNERGQKPSGKFPGDY